MTGPLATGDLIGDRYEVLRYIDKGGMQFVYAAKDRLSDRHVALKTPQNSVATKRFHRSAVVAAKVNHPNVAKTLDYVSEGGRQFLVEELIQGADLSKAMLTRASFLDPYMVARILHHVAKGLAAAHHAGVIHRDLKPTNLMVVGGYSPEEVKITDFGIAKMTEEELVEAVEGGDATLTTSATAIGALPYMAPEAIDTPKNVSRAVDIWSTGAMVFQLLTGEMPFGSGLRAVRKIMDAKLPEPPAFVLKNPQFSPLAREILEVVFKCLSKSPDDRPTADQLVKMAGNLCYSLSFRGEGVVKRIDHNAWGFISCQSGDVFFHKNSLYGVFDELKKGDSVLFSAYDGGGAPRAYPLIKIKSYES